MGWVAASRATVTPAIRSETDWRAGAIVFALAMMTEPVLACVMQALGRVEPTALDRLFWLPVYAAILPMIWIDRRETARAALATPMLLALLAFALVSTIWSIDGAVTFRRAAALLVTMLFAWRLATTGWAVLLRALAGAWALLVVGSFAFAVLWPAAGVMGAESTHPGAWSGVWTHKNLLGGMMALGVTIFAAAAATDRAKRLLWLAFALAAFTLVLKSTSTTGLLGTLLGLGVMAFGAVWRRGPRAALLASGGLALMVIVGAFTVSVAPDLFFDAVGKDSTLTGRTDIWGAAMDAVAARPFLGHGFGAFWADKEGPAYWVRAAVDWAAPNAHNGWLELVLALGWTGLALFALSLLRTLPRIAASLADPVAGLIAPPLAAIFLLLTLSEGYILQDNNTLWALFVVLSGKLALKRSGKESP